MQCTVLPHITASVFLSLRSGQASTTTTASGPVVKPHRRGRLSKTDTTADAHLKRHGPPSEAVVVAVTNGRLDGFGWRSTELTPRARRNLWYVGADLSRPGGKWSK